MRTEYIFGAGFLVAIALITGYAVYDSKRPGAYDEFAQCIAESGTIFYGAFWCPHCQNQKAMFGKSAELLPYVECSTPDGRAQLSLCTEVGVEGYPTWVFPDGSRESGEVPLSELAAKTGCELLE
jgi:hypothetical protein